MDILRSIVLGVVQGTTEFLPVSSSGHLVLTKGLLGIHTQGVALEVALHFGTLIAVVLFLRRELRDILVAFVSGALSIGKEPSGWKAAWAGQPDFRMACHLIVATLPAAVLGLAFRHHIENLFSNPVATAAMLFVTGEILWLTRPHSLLRLERRASLADAFRIGLAQAAALIPGISRSGATISTGLLRDIGREQAARFSFLLSVPVILGAAVLEAREISALSTDDRIPLLLGVATAAVTGYLALHFLMRVVRRGRLHVFAYYCWAVSVAGVGYFWAIAPPRYW